MSERVLLESIVTEIRNGVDAEQMDQPLNGMLPISRIETIWNGVIDFERVKYAQVTKAEIDKYALQSGDILFSHINSPAHIGKTAIYRSDQPLIHGINLLLIRVDQKKCYPEYLNYYFKTKNVRALFRARCKKAVNQASLNQPDILELEVPLPPLTEQKRIASLLRRADRLRQLRRTAHDLGDALLQSVFLEMFGDPQFNDKKWDLVTLGDKITFMTSGSRGWAEYYSDKGDLFLRIQNVGANQLLLDDVAYVQAPDTVESKRTKVLPGDLLISATADLGRTAVIPENFPTAYINQHLFLLRLKDLNPVFVAGYFSTPTGKAQILRLDREGVKSGLNFDDARSLSVFNPPLSLQEEFAGVVRRVESLRGRMSEAERQVEELFESLLSESFA